MGFLVAVAAASGSKVNNTVTLSLYNFKTLQPFNQPNKTITNLKFLRYVWVLILIEKQVYTLP